MRRRYERAAGVLIEPVGHLWAAFSQDSGETALLNDECAAVLEVLSEHCCDTEAVAAMLAADSGLEPGALVAVVEASWPVLIDAGLARPQGGRLFRPL